MSSPAVNIGLITAAAAAIAVMLAGDVRQHRQERAVTRQAPVPRDQVPPRPPRLGFGHQHGVHDPAADPCGDPRRRLLIRTDKEGTS